MGKRMAENTRKGGKKRTGSRGAGGRARPARRKTASRVATETQSPPRRGGRRLGETGRLPGKKLFAGLRKGDGCGALLTLAERMGDGWDEVSNVCELGLSFHGTVGGRKRVGGRIAPRTCRALAAVGHTARVRLLAKMLEGPATYRALHRVSKLKPGPLYHHINQLRLAGLILPKQRDLYELTRGGRNLILTVIVLGPLLRDGRRRPVPAVGG